MKPNPGENSNSTSVVDWLNKWWQYPVMECHTAVKKNELLDTAGVAVTHLLSKEARHKGIYAT